MSSRWFPAWFRAIGSLAIALAGAAPGRAGDRVWTSGGPYGAHVSELAISPSAPSTLYLTTGGVSGGGEVYRSSTAGAEWSRAMTGLTSAVYALAVDPGLPSTVYAAASGGVFKSTSGGDTWVESSAGLPSCLFYSVAVDPLTPSTVYVGANACGVYKSTDGATTWSPVNSGLSPVFTVDQIVIDPLTPTTLYVVSRYGGGVSKSMNGGGTWTSVGLLVDYVVDLAVDPQIPTTLYAATANAGLYKSTDRGATWTRAAELPYVNRLVIDPKTPSNLYAGTVGGVMKSTDSGATWSPSGLVGLDPYVEALAIDPVNPSVLYAGNPWGYGVTKSSSAGASWSAVNEGLQDLSAEVVAADPRVPGTVYAGTSAGAFKTTDAGGTWVRTGPPRLIASLAIAPAGPPVVYAGTDNGVVKSADGGTTWVSAGLSGTVFALAIDPLAPSTLYAGTWGAVSKSTDGGGTWALVTNGLPVFPPVYPPPPEDVRALAVDPSSPSTIYAVVGIAGIYKSVDGGALWFAANTGVSAFNGVRRLAIDPETPSTVYAATDGGLFKSTDGSAVWASGGPSGRALAIDSLSSSTLYVGSSAGPVSRSTDAGATWTTVKTSAGNDSLSDLALDPTEPTTVYAALYGGVWQATPPVGPDSDLALTLSASPEPVTGTTPLTYVIQATNIGPSAVGPVTVTQSLPVGAVLARAVGAGWSCAESAGVVGCSRPGLEVGAAPPITVVVRPGPAAGVIVSTARVSAPETDPVPANNVATVMTTVKAARAWLGVRTKEASSSSGRFVVNGDLTYTITLRNDGPEAQPDNPGPELEDFLPSSSLTLVSAQATTGTVGILPGDGIFWDGEIPSGGSVEIDVRAKIKPAVALGTVVTNQAVIHYDADGNGTNEATIETDDPRQPGGNDPTSFHVVSPPLSFYTLPPCRLVDTREAAGPFGGPALPPQGGRTFAPSGRCGVPATARAVSFNATVTGPTAAGHIRLYPAGTPVPVSSSLNFEAGQTRANNVTVTLNGLGELTVFAFQTSGTVDVILDVNGYFEE